MMRPEPTLPQKIAAIHCPRELDGFTGQLEADGNLNVTLLQLITTRRAEIALAEIKDRKK
jgi:hypothetical protein